MKLSVMQENLARGLSVVSRAVSGSRATLPVLSNVLLRTEDAGLKLTATNLEIGISTWVPGKIEHEGALTVPARLITDVVNGLPAGERIDLEVEGGTTLHLRSGRAQARIRGIDAEEFPVVPTAGERAPTRLAQKALRHALSEVVFAAASDEARPILTGVLTKIADGTMTLAAADNYRIAVRTMGLADRGEDASIVVPARSFAEVSRILAETDDPVDVVLAPSRNQVIFKVEGTSLVSRLIDGQFPNYQQVLPASHSTRVVVDRDELLKAVRLSALIATTSANVVRLRIGEPGSAGIQIAASADIGDTEGEVEAAVEGDAVSVAFNARYLAEALQNMVADQLSLELSGPLSPGVLRLVGDEHYVHVIMPVRTPS